MTIRERAGEVLVRTGGLMMIAAGVMIIVPALCPSRVMTVLPEQGGETVGETTDLGPIDPAALTLLTSAAETTRVTAWHGTQLISIFGPRPTTAVVDVAYVPGVGSWTSVRHGATAAAPQEWLFEAGAVADPSGQPTDWLSLVTSHFRVVQGSTAASDQMSETIVLRRSDGSTAARLFIDSGTNLIVGREIYDLSGNLLRVSNFSDFSSTDAGTIARLGYSPASADKKVSTGGQRLNADQLEQWRAAGWTVPVRLHRDFDLVDARSSAQDPDDPGVHLHLTYSDGLSTVSVFGERGRLDPRTMSGWRSTHRSSWPVLDHSGIHDQVAWSDGTRVWIVVGDAATSVVDRAVAVLPHKRDRDAYAQRFTGGLRRIGSWLNPLA